MEWDGMGFEMGFGTMGIGILSFPTIWAASIETMVEIEVKVVKWM